MDRPVAEKKWPIAIGDRGLRFGLAAVLAYALTLAVLLLSAPLPAAQLVLIDNLAQAIGPLAVVLIGLTLSLGRPSATHGLGRWSPGLLALACASWASGQLIWTYHEQVLGQPLPLGSWADVCYFATYPLLLAGIFGLPNQALSLATRVRLVFDGLLVAATLTAYNWYFLLGPALLRSDQPSEIKAVTAAYALCDLAVLIALLWIGLQPGHPTFGASVRLLVVGLGLIVATNTAFQYLVLHERYATGTLLDIGWPLGYMLIGLAAYGVRREIGHRAARRDASAGWAAGQPMPPFDKRPAFWRVLLPYLSLPIIGLLFIHAWITAAEVALVRGILVASGVIIAILILHQMIVIAESWQFARDLDSVYRSTLGRMEQFDQLLRLATTDALTGLLNRRGLNAAMEEMLARAAAIEAPGAVVLLDLDRFKALNDTYGHLVGDEALREVGMLLQARQQGELRSGRWGGEEFLLVLPGRDEAAARDYAEELRATVAAHVCQVAGGIRITCSLGVAVYPQDGRDAAELIAAADRAMYTAKCLGRNQVFAASDPAVATLMSDVGAETQRGDEALAGTVETLATLVKVRDQYGGQHADEIAHLSVQVALALGCGVAEAHQIGVAGRLHDVGKVTIPDAVLRKATALNDEEWAQVRLHPATGEAIIGRVPDLRLLAPLVRSHHERWDGAGYPDGLLGAAIPLGARIIAVTEAYGALTANRPYRAGRAPAEALAELRRCAGSQFDPLVVATLERVLDTPPNPPEGEQRARGGTGPLRAWV